MIEGLGCFEMKPLIACMQKSPRTSFPVNPEDGTSIWCQNVEIESKRHFRVAALLQRMGDLNHNSVKELSIVLTPIQLMTHLADL